ncbi:MAG TPA: TetR/AcrR family transcriptional regulator [Frankiaceae bacterium]|nr:TetR/AcrR family transcriptional regulator [Frankiaceae bacterium]
MSSGYELSGRTGQKRRTRTALVDAARALVAEGVTPTVEQAAEAAAISRTTAYRYFTNQRALLAAAHPETAATSLLPAPPPVGAAARLDAVVASFTRIITDTEDQQRTMLRLSLEAGETENQPLPLRRGRAIGWIAEALEPLHDQLADAEVDALVLAVRATTGIEALVWLTDVAGLSREQAVALMRWSAQALLRTAITVPPPTPTPMRS